MRSADLFCGTPAALAAALMFLVAAGARAQSPALQFKFEAYTAKESAPTAPITVVRLGATNDAVSVDYATLNTAEAGTTATPDVDYTPVSGTLNFAPGVRSLTFAVPLRQDAEDELNETVTLELMNPVNATLGGQANATLTITDDDVCAYTLAPTGRTHGPEGGGAEFTMNATAGCRWTVTETASWLSVITPSGTGTLSVVYSVDPNPLTAQRSAVIRVAGKSFTVTQRGVPPPDLTRPVVTIAAPAAGARITNLPFNVTGKASDAGGVARVEFRVENAAGTNEFWTPADGSTNWTASVDGLRPGLNTVRVRAYDTSGNYASNGVARSFNYVVVSPLSLTIDGGGVVAGARDGQFLDVGKTYTVTATATPVKSNLFAGWTGGVPDSTASRLTFVMRTNLALTARFVPNPFLEYKGTHQGLVAQDGASARHESSGFFTAAVTDLGAYTARLTLAGKVIPLSGRFALLDGFATNVVPRTGLNPLTVFLALNSGSITGLVSDGNWASALAADRMLAGGVTDPPPVPGRYKLVIPGDDDAARSPHGFSFATATMDAAGRISVAATLADGTAFAQATTLSLRRRWPLFGRLYGGAGQMLGWMQMPSEEFPLLGEGGSGHWFKTPVASPRFYTNGFGLAFEATTARYVPPAVAATPFLRFTNDEVVYTGGLVSFSGGNVFPPFTNVVRVDPGNKIVGLGTTDQGTNRLTMTYAPASGAFSGSVTVPGTTRSIPFKGSLYGGFFLGSNECGRVLLQAAP